MSIIPGEEQAPPQAVLPDVWLSLRSSSLKATRCVVSQGREQLWGFRRNYCRPAHATC